MIKLDSYPSILKPAFNLLLLNSILCLLFSLLGGLSIGISWIFYEQFGLPIPLMPLTVAAFTLFSIVTWVVFGKRLDLDKRQRIITAAAGVSPLILVSMGALLGALTLISVPRDLGSASLGSAFIALVALVAAACCAACVIWIPNRKVAPATEGSSR